VAAIFVVDGQAGVQTLDEEIAKFLRLQKCVFGVLGLGDVVRSVAS
jgi:predicted GTPase